MLRFNGQSPMAAPGAFSAFPGKVVGTATGVTVQTGMQPVWGIRRNSTAAFGELAGQIDGTVHPVSWLMPLQSGRISARGTEIDFTTSTTIVAGFPIVGSVSATFTVGPSRLELVVSATGAVSFDFSLTGNAVAVIQAVGALNITFDVGPSTLGAESGIFGNSLITFTGSATARGDGNISGAVTPFTELSPQSLAAAVWDALLANHTTVGSAGYALANISAGSTPEQIASAILAAAQATPIHADTRKMNGATVTGTGAANDLWRGV